MQKENHDILNFCKTIWIPGEVREIRAFNDRGYVDFGYFDSPEKAARAAWKKKGTHEIYITLNPCNPALLARSKNRMRQAGKKRPTTSDRDIDKLKFILVDVDPCRPAGISSTSGEMETAREISLRIHQGVGHPIVFAMSGNGFHSIYPHDMTETEEIKEFLANLNDRYGTDKAKIDLSVFNPARITKVIGTWAKKGDNTPERPHRQSELILTGGKGIIKPRPKEAKPLEPVYQVEKVSWKKSSFDVREFLRKYNVVVKEEKPWRDCALVALENCIFDSSHQGNESGVLIHPSGKLTYQCFHDSCKGKTWPQARESLEGPRKNKRRQKKKRGKIPSDPDLPKTVVVDEPGENKVLTVDYLAFFRAKGWKFSLNELTDSIQLNGQLLDDFTLDEIKAAVRDAFDRPSISHAVETISVTAKRRKFNPVKDFLNGLSWDGEDHMGELCSHFHSKNGLFARWFHYWLPGAVARVFDNYQNPVLVLDGPQETGKSYFTKWLCPVNDLYMASAIFPDQKDCRLRLADTLIWEINELGGTTRRQDIEALKAFLTLEKVRDRRPYARYDAIKTCISSFIGTINNDAGFLLDRTGNRRFLVAEIQKIEWEYTAGNKSQVWAQAVHLWREGGWEITIEDKLERESQNEKFLVSDPIEEILLDLVEFSGNGSNYVLVPDLLAILKEKIGNVNRGTTMAISSFFMREGAIKDRIFSDGRKVRGYRGCMLRGVYSVRND